MGQLTNLYVSQSYQGLIKLTDSTTGVTGTLQYLQDGLGNRLPIQMSTSSVSITGSLHGTASYATQALSASWAPDNTDTGSYVTTSSFNAYTSSNDSKVNSLITSTGSYATTSSLTALSQSIATTDLSQNNRLTSIESITGSLATTSSLTSLSSSIASTDLGQNNRLGSIESKTGSYATTGSNVFQGLQTISGSLIVTGSITALSASITYLETVYQTSSIIFSSGSNILGDEASDTQTLWGRVAIPTGPVSVTGSVIATNFTGSLQGTASYATQALSASQAQNANTASFALNGGVTQILAGPNIIVSPLSGQGQVTISSTGTGTGSFNTATGSYGSFYDTTTQLNPVANTPNSMSFNETAITNGVSISGSLSPFNTYIKTQNAGVYNIQFSAQVDKTDSGTDSVDIWIRKNGIDLLDSATTVTLTGNNDKSVAAWNWFVQSATNDYYQLIWASADTDMRLLAEASSSVHPGVPSVILTANRVDQFLSNTGSFNGDFNGSFTGSLQGTASFATNALSASYAPGVSIPAGTVSGSQQIVELGFATTSSVNQKLDTGSFNSYTASMDARTGSYITTGSAAGTQSITGSLILSGSAGVELDVKGDQTNTGSVNILGSLNLRGNQVISGSLLTNTSNDGLIKVTTEAQSSSSLSVPFGYISASAAVSQSNLIFGTSTGLNGNGQLSNNQTGSIVISGSNNIILAGGNRTSTLAQGTYGYVNGSLNFVNSYPTLTTSSIIRPSINNNNLNSSVAFAFTTSSLAAPQFSNNNVQNTLTINHQSGSLSYTANINVGAVTSTANNIALPFLTSIGSNYMGGTGLFLNHISSSITVTNNIFGGAAFSVTNLVSSSVSATNNGLSLLNNLVVGQANGVWVSGSNPTNRRNITSNIIGGVNTAVSSSQVGAEAHLYGTIVYGQNLIVSASHALANGGSAFFGRYNDTTTLSDSQNIVFAVGTGTAISTRRTGLYVTSGSLVGVSGSLQVIGDTTITGSVQGNVNALSISSNTASLDLNTGNFFTLQLVSGSATHINPSNIKPGQTVNIRINTTGSATVTFPSSVDQVSGSSYVPTTTTGIDIITLVSFDSSILFLANVKNLV